MRKKKNKEIERHLTILHLREFLVDSFTLVINEQRVVNVSRYKDLPSFIQIGQLVIFFAEEQLDIHKECQCQCRRL